MASARDAMLWRGVHMSVSGDDASLLGSAADTRAPSGKTPSGGASLTSTVGSSKGYRVAKPTSTASTTGPTSSELSMAHLSTTTAVPPMLEKTVNSSSIATPGGACACSPSISFFTRLDQMVVSLALEAGAGDSSEEVGAAGGEESRESIERGGDEPGAAAISEKSKIR